MDTIFTNSENSKLSDPHRQLLNLSDKINLKRKDEYVALSNLSIYYTSKNLKSHTKSINLNYQIQGGMINLNYLMDHILYEICNIISNISLRGIEKRLIILQQEYM